MILDQVLKVYIKTNLEYGGSIDLLGLSWAKIHFVENEGMAFGFSFGGFYGKLFLSLFRIVMIGFLVYLLRGLIKAKESMGLVLSFGLIIAGAIGNMIDSAFYGLIFSESSFHHREIAQIFPPEGGYAGFLHGRVVDMLYFPLFDTTLPEWLPFWGGERFQFFKPVFNIADASISVGVACILLFHRSFFKAKSKEENPDASVDNLDTEVKIEM